MTPLTAVAHRYAAFATDSPALCDAVFSRPTRLHFGPDSAPAPSAASELQESITPRTVDADDVELLT